MPSVTILLRLDYVLEPARDKVLAKQRGLSGSKATGKDSLTVRRWKDGE